MEFLRGIVSGKKIRYDQDGFNLDLTYITDRIIAMCFPGSGFESFYRNDIDDVANFLDKTHGSGYMIFNLGGRPYDYVKFKHRVKEFDWEDHHSPNLDLLFKACQQIDDFLQKNPEHVIVVHCNAGKGRTGTLICCYMLYSGRFDKGYEAMEYYKKKRFESGGGVTQPSQMRYVEYFSHILNRHLKNEPPLEPVLVQIEKIVINGMPKYSFRGYIKPFIELYDVKEKKIKYTTKKLDEEPPKFLRKFVGDDVIPIDLSQSEIMCGDILVRVHDFSKFGSELICRFGFNTAFLPKASDNKIVRTYNLQDLDPGSLRKDDRFPSNFRVEFHLSTIPPDQVQGPQLERITALYEREKRDMGHIYDILKNYKQRSMEEAQCRLFKSPERDDVNGVFKIPKNPFLQVTEQKGGAPEEEVRTEKVQAS